MHYIKPIFALLMILTTINGYAQTDWKKELTKNVVKVEDGKYSVERYVLYTIGNMSSIHLEMTNTGIQIQFTVDGETSRQTMTWEDFYKEN